MILTVSDFSDTVFLCLKTTLKYGKILKNQIGGKGL